MTKNITLKVYIKCMQNQGPLYLSYSKSRFTLAAALEDAVETGQLTVRHPLITYSPLTIMIWLRSASTKATRLLPRDILDHPLGTAE